MSLEVGNREEVLAALRRRDVDLAVGGRLLETQDISGTAFRDYRLVVVSTACGCAQPRP